MSHYSRSTSEATEKKKSIITPSQDTELGKGRPFDPRANGFRMLVSALETESSVKLLAFGTPLNGQRDPSRATGEAKVKVLRKVATRIAREDMTSDRGVRDCSRQTVGSAVSSSSPTCLYRQIIETSSAAREAPSSLMKRQCCRCHWF